MSRQVFWTLAVAALFLRIAVPAGFMLGRMTAASPLQIVICTGKGELQTATLDLRGDRDHAPPGKSAHDSPCAFAGHGLGAPPPSLADAGRIEFFAFAEPALAQARHASPGRGLSGPPLPARGPPAALI